MDEFKKYLLYQKEITQDKLKTINRFLKGTEGPLKKRTSKIDIV